MRKLNDSFFEKINAKNICANELVILPEDGDAGFVEYFEYKADKIIEAKKLFSSVSKQNRLMLEFPAPDSIEPNVFNKFYESPVIVSKNHTFEGLFAIDISNYTDKLDNDYFIALLSYIKTNPQAVFILFFYSEKQNEINNVYRFLSQHMEIVKTEISMPKPEQLASYTLDGCGSFCTDGADAADAFLKQYYTKNKIGYDSADYIIRNVRMSAFEGTVEQFKDFLEKIDVLSSTGCDYNGWGY